MDMRKPLYSFAIHPAQLAALKKIQQRTGAPVSEQLRRAIDLWLRREGVKLETTR
jgi:hypothetical protein